MQKMHQKSTIHTKNLRKVKIEEPNNFIDIFIYEKNDEIMCKFYYFLFRNRQNFIKFPRKLQCKDATNNKRKNITRCTNKPQNKSNQNMKKII